MSHHSYTCIEQLDLAAEQMQRGAASYSRFALILTDNVVELILHRACLELISIDNIWVKLGEPKYTVKQRKEASGQWFGGKVKFLVLNKKLTKDQAEFINICHEYRNELYHAGLLYDDIVYDIAWSYHDFAIMLLEKINPNNSWHAMAQITPAVAKHAGDDGSAILFRMGSVVKSLRVTRPIKKRSLPVALSVSANKRVTELIDEMHFLVKNDLRKRTKEKNLFDVQMYAYLQDNPQLMSEIKTPQQYFKLIENLTRAWRPQYTTSPLPKYRVRAQQIAKAKSDIQALRYFEKFRQDISYFGNIVDSASASLDRHLSDLVDEARGK